MAAGRRIVVRRPFSRPEALLPPVALDDLLALPLADVVVVQRRRELLRILPDRNARAPSEAVHADRRDVDEALDARPHRGIAQVLDGLHVDGKDDLVGGGVIVDSRHVEDRIDTFEERVQALAAGEIRGRELDAEAVEEGPVAPAGEIRGPHLEPRPGGLDDHVMTGEAVRSGHEYSRAILGGGHGSLALSSRMGPRGRLGRRERSRRFHPGCRFGARALRSGEASRWLASPSRESCRGTARCSPDAPPRSTES